MKVLYMMGVFLLLLLLTGTVGSAQVPLALPDVDYDCDGEITVNDVLMMVPEFGSTTPLNLWFYDLDHDGAINEIDALIAVVEIGRTDLPAPVWCQNENMEYTQ